MQNIRDISSLCDIKAAACMALSDAVWDLAELRYQEHGAVAAQVALLEKEGFRITRDIAGIPTAFMAEAGHDSGGGNGPLIGLLGEYDALSGLGQASGVTERRSTTQANGQGCGHNLLGAGAMLAAIAVKDYLAQHRLPGRVRYYGCPAEEGGSGKTFMARAGLFADLDAAVTWHPGSFFGVMSVNSLANIQAYFRFSGRAAHAASAPHLGRSALDAVELMNVGVNYMREHMPSNTRVHYAITDTGGISPNVVQARAEVLYLVRGPSVALANTLFERVKKIAEGAALMTETQAFVDFDKACSEVLPNMALEWAMHRNIEQLGPVQFDDADRAFAERMRRDALTPEDVFSSLRSVGEPTTYDRPLHEGILPFDGTPRQLYGSTDVGDVSWLTPTVQCWAPCFAVGTPGHSWQLVAQGKQPAAHKAMLQAAKAMAATAIDAFSDEALLKSAREEWEQRTAGAPYSCPIPPLVELPFERKNKPGILLGAGTSPFTAAPLSRSRPA
ncbi:MAG: M20 family metallopeptidase [Ferrovibrio sp.]|uniref:M20 family metallopeptidase n=1 Tax=Ferrovibrio sp. TaxID=1917215 RepID=UPI00261FD55B|nr:M20 family metallopeptidase [Ferrovibrio sp.]MCW0234218.1 M20 family metallopeptidase [Ferrovibrio sp.]